MSEEMRCAECDCENGGSDCNWIRTPPELLPCPFCGERADGYSEEVMLAKKKVTMYGVDCSMCSAGVGAHMEQQTADDAWNTRQAPKVKALVDEIRSHVNLDENHEADLIPISTHLLLKRILSALEE